LQAQHRPRPQIARADRCGRDPPRLPRPPSRRRSQADARGPPPPSQNRRTPRHRQLQAGLKASILQSFNSFRMDLSKLCVHTITTKPWSIEVAMDKYAAAGIGGITVWRQALEGRDIAKV